jgi:sugar O-acyltransferase (sialic acid O-acetyltransferase NeuD family)
VVVAEAAALAAGAGSIAGFLDDNPNATLSTLEFRLPHPFPTPPYLGELRATDRLNRHAWIIAIGDLRARQRALRGLEEGGLLADAPGRPGPASVIHPSAVVSPSATIEPGVFVGPGAVVHSRVRVEAHAIINTGAVVEHDCVVGEGAHVAPGAVLGGGVRVGAWTLIGLGARVLPNLRVGAAATVGAGGVVVEEVASGAVVVGVPARPRD